MSRPDSFPNRFRFDGKEMGSESFVQSSEIQERVDVAQLTKYLRQTRRISEPFLRVASRLTKEAPNNVETSRTAGGETTTHVVQDFERKGFENTGEQGRIFGVLSLRGGFSLSFGDDALRSRGAITSVAFGWERTRIQG